MNSTTTETLTTLQSEYARHTAARDIAKARQHDAERAKLDARSHSAHEQAGRQALEASWALAEAEAALQELAPRIEAARQAAETARHARTIQEVQDRENGLPEFDREVERALQRLLDAIGTRRAAALRIAELRAELAGRPDQPFLDETYWAKVRGGLSDGIRAIEQAVR